MALTTPYSFQLYSARTAPSLDDTLTMLGELGYTAVEPYGGMLEDPTPLANGLARTGLKAPSTHVGLDMVENALDDTVAKAKDLGIELLLVPHIGGPQRPTDLAGWRAFGDRLAAIADQVHARGLRFGWHNHDFEFAALDDGSFPIEHVLANPAVLWECDVAWVVRGGQDPLQWLSRYAGRLVGTHVKDIAGEGEKQDEDGWEDVGHGVLDWPALWRAAVDAGAEIMVAEHDKPSDPRRFAERSIVTMKRLNGE